MQSVETQLVNAAKVTTKLGNNEMYRKEQFVLLGVSGREELQRGDI